MATGGFILNALPTGSTDGARAVVDRLGSGPITADDLARLEAEIAGEGGAAAADLFVDELTEVRRAMETVVGDPASAAARRAYADSVAALVAAMGGRVAAEARREQLPAEAQEAVADAGYEFTVYDPRKDLMDPDRRNAMRVVTSQHATRASNSIVALAEEVTRGGGTLTGILSTLRNKLPEGGTTKALVTSVIQVAGSYEELVKKAVLESTYRRQDDPANEVVVDFLTIVYDIMGAGYYPSPRDTPRSMIKNDEYYGTMRRAHDYMKNCARPSRKRVPDLYEMITQRDYGEDAGLLHQRLAELTGAYGLRARTFGPDMVQGQLGMQARNNATRHDIIHAEQLARAAVYEYLRVDYRF